MAFKGEEHLKQNSDESNPSILYSKEIWFYLKMETKREEV